MMRSTLQDLVKHYRVKGVTLPGTDVALIRHVGRQSWELRHEWITIGSKLGEGAFGEVFKGVLRLPSSEGDKPVAVKRSHAHKELSKAEIIEVIAGALPHSCRRSFQSRG